MPTWKRREVSRSEWQTYCEVCAGYVACRVGRHSMTSFDCSSCDFAILAACRSTTRERWLLCCCIFPSVGSPTSRLFCNEVVVGEVCGCVRGPSFFPRHFSWYLARRQPAVNRIVPRRRRSPLLPSARLPGTLQDISFHSILCLSRGLTFPMARLVPADRFSILPERGCTESMSIASRV